MQVHITEHAFQRARERLGFSRSTTQRMADRAFADGTTHAETAGRLNRYLTGLYLSHRRCNSIRVRGEVVWLFGNNILITVFQLPRELLKRR